MAENKLYVAITEEPMRGTVLSPQVGFVPLMGKIPRLESDDKKKELVITK